MVSMGDKGGAYKVLVGRPEGMRPPGRRRRRWENNIQNVSSRSRMGGSGTALVWLRIRTGAGARECNNEPSGSIKCG